jgi:hypothetical protein
MAEVVYCLQCTVKAVQSCCYLFTVSSAGEVAFASEEKFRCHERSSRHQRVHDLVFLDIKCTICNFTSFVNKGKNFCFRRSDLLCHQT